MHSSHQILKRSSLGPMLTFVINSSESVCASYILHMLWQVPVHWGCPVQPHLTNILCAICLFECTPPGCKQIICEYLRMPACNANVYYVPSAPKDDFRQRLPPQNHNANRHLHTMCTNGRGCWFRFAWWSCALPILECLAIDGINITVSYKCSQYCFGELLLRPDHA